MKKLVLLSLASCLMIGCSSDSLESTTTVSQEQAEHLAGSLLILGLVQAGSQFTDEIEDQLLSENGSGSQSLNYDNVDGNCANEGNGETITNGSAVVNYDQSSISFDLETDYMQCGDYDAGDPEFVYSGLLEISGNYTEITSETPNIDLSIRGLLAVEGSEVEDGDCAVSVNFNTSGNIVTLTAEICGKTVQESEDLGED